MKNKRVILTGLVALILGTGLTWAAIAALVPASDAGPGTPEGPDTAASLEEAEEKVGYEIATPKSIPEGFEKNGVLGVWHNADLGSSVDQTWTVPGTPSWFMLTTQDPGVSGIGNGEPYQFAGRQGERRVVPAQEPHRPYDMLVLFWRDNDMSYTLRGALSADLTEEVLVRIAESVSLD